MTPQTMHAIRGRYARLAPTFDDADDMEQEGWLAVVEVTVRFDPSRASLDTFVDRRVRGAMVDWLRSWYGRTYRLEYAGVDPDTLVCTPADDLDLQLALEGLTAREQQVIGSIYYVGLEHWEIAEVLGVHKSRVSQIHNHALAKLRSALEAE